MSLTKLISFLVLALEMENVHSKDDPAKECVLLLLQMFLKPTIVVEEDHVWQIVGVVVVNRLEEVLLVE